MRLVQVQLLFFAGCPHVDVARRLLREALRSMAHPPDVIELDVTSASTPEELRSWGSPTILVDGVDVAGGVPSGRSCRIYPGSPDPHAPSLGMIQTTLAARQGLP